MMKNAVLVAVFLLLWTGASAQIAERLQAEVCGSILDASDLQPIPYVNVYVRHGYGMSSNINGYFSLPCFGGDTIVFSCIGYETVRYVVPDSLVSKTRTVGVIMTADTVMLPEVVVLPKIDFERIEYEMMHLPPDAEMQVATANVSEAVHTALTMPSTYLDEGPKAQLSAYTMRLEYAGMFSPAQSFTFIGTNSGIVHYLKASRMQKRRTEQFTTKYSPSSQKQLQMIEDVRKFVTSRSDTANVNYGKEEAQ